MFEHNFINSPFQNYFPEPSEVRQDLPDPPDRAPIPDTSRRDLLEEFKTDRDQCQLENVVLKRRLCRASEDNSELRRKLAKNEEEKKRMQMKLLMCSLEAKIKQYENDCEELKRHKCEREQCQQENSELKRQLSRIKEENVELKREVTYRKADGTRMWAKLEMCLIDNEKLQAKINQHERERKEFKRCKSLQLVTMNSLKLNVTRCREDRERLEAEVSGLKKERNRLEAELDRCKDSRKILEIDLDQHRRALICLMHKTEADKTERDKVSRVSNATHEEIFKGYAASKDPSKYDCLKILEVNGETIEVEVIFDSEGNEVVLRDKNESKKHDASIPKEREDFGWLLQRMEQFKSERDSLSEKVEDQSRMNGRLQTELDKVRAEKANLQKMTKTSKKRMSGQEKVLLENQLEKEQLHATLARLRLDVEVLESKVRRHEADKKHADELSALLKTSLDATEWRQYIDNSDSTATDQGATDQDKEEESSGNNSFFKTIK